MAWLDWLRITTAEEIRTGLVKKSSYVDLDLFFHDIIVSATRLPPSLDVTRLLCSAPRRPIAYYLEMGCIYLKYVALR